MPSDIAIQELLYAILKQKCLKDIDWHKVASDPILTTAITNGHAARMRYARFKKQIERAYRDRVNGNPNGPPNPNPPSPRQPRATGPKRSRVEKNESPKKIKRGSNTAAIAKQEAMDNAAEEDREREGTVDSTLPLDPNHLMAIKREHAHHRHQNQNHSQGRDSLMTPVDTPANYCIENRSQSPSPGPVASNQHSFEGMADDYATSFGMGSQGNLFGEVQSFDGLGMDLNIGMGEFGGIWDGGLGEENVDADGVLVKQEPRWGEEYRHV